ncbi:hypothetical protein ACFT7S_19420 [Streptomyces sp. NPDC057136]|uniref:hypothetical protein n=1 Tax=Streptomyces sp. NPDC057136 TaxID=3346029 RepID=UPI00363F828C
MRAGFPVGRTIDPGGFDLHQDIEPDALGRTVSVGRPSSQDAGDGRFVSTVAYDEAQLVRQRIGDPAGSMKTRRVRYDSASRPALMLSPAGRIQKLRYDERSLVAAVIDDLAGVRAVTRRTYERRRMPRAVIDPRGATTR